MVGLSWLREVGWLCSVTGLGWVQFVVGLSCCGGFGLDCGAWWVGVKCIWVVRLGWVVLGWLQMVGLGQVGLCWLGGLNGGRSCVGGTVEGWVGFGWRPGFKQNLKLPSKLGLGFD